MRDVGVGQLVDELQERGDRLPFEIGAFVALEACEGLLQESVKLAADDVRVTLDGTVVVSTGAESVAPAEAAQSLVSMLSKLLVAAGPGVPPHLLRLVEEEPADDQWQDLQRLHDAIEASLIPLNRGASRRVLARLVRESDRPPAPEAPVQAPVVAADQLDAELDELLEETPAPPIEAKVEPTIEPEPDPEPEPKIEVQAAPEPEPEPEAELIAAEPMEPIAHAEEAEVATAIDITLETAPDIALEPDTRPEITPPPSIQMPDPVVALPPDPPPIAEALDAIEDKSEPDAVETAAEAVRTAAREEDAIPPIPSRRGPWRLALLALIAGAGMFAVIQSGTIDALLSSVDFTSTAPGPTAGIIDLTVTPEDAQVFLYTGRGPAIAYDLAVAGPHEFVVFDQSVKPTRGVVPEGGSWTGTTEGPLYELAVQAPPAAGGGDTLDLGAPVTERPSAGEGPTGRVRVITNPPAAKVYRLVGIGPRVLIDVQSIAEGQEVLVYHPDHVPRRAVIGPSDWQASTDAKPATATLQVGLPKATTDSARGTNSR